MEQSNNNTRINSLFWYRLHHFLPGHARELQASVSVAEPLQGAPPFSAGVVSVLVRVLVPPPHVAEQVDHSPYSPHTQSTTSIYENKR